ncbi:hypothetical protein, partial [Streptomyces laculatispora]|uniref:hypothetical protein n=1 Tax=Streptomyces laculatispora TaxID=887464 RepID=UPI001A9466EF
MPRHQTTQTTSTTRHQHHTLTHTRQHPTRTLTRTRSNTGGYLHQARDQYFTATHGNLRLTGGQHHTRNVPEHPTRGIHIDQHNPARVLR